MVFSSTIFLYAFLPITLIGYYVLRKELKNIFLLCMSLFFYAWGEPRFVVVMVGSIAVNYVMGLIIERTKQNSLIIRRLALLAATGANLIILFYFKYFDFFFGIVNNIFNTDIAMRHIALPIGISFFTFQSMSYIFDLYMGKVPVQKNPISIALYIALFPQLIAGPIVRYSTVNDQIYNRTHTFDKFGEGVKRFIIGLAKKTICSNMFAIVADMIFNMPSDGRSVVVVWIGAIAYMMQIYFDFSGYSDMAIGLGKMFGFDFLENFNYPYISKSVTDFWRRWHISLSSWFKDYVYIPLGGNRKGNVYVNLLIVFFVTGLWHGASWNFIAWGMWHGVFLIIERLLKKYYSGKPLPQFFKWLYTMLIVIIGWIMFRAPTLTDAIVYLKDMFGMNGRIIFDETAWLLIQENILLLAICTISATPITTKIKRLINENPRLQPIYAIASILFYIIIMVVSFSFVVIGGYNPFIYFNF